MSTEPGERVEVDTIAELRRLERELARLRNLLRADSNTVSDLPPERFQLLRLIVRGQTYGIALDHVVEIVRIARFVEQGPDQGALLGVLNYRGTAVPVIDVGRRVVGTGTAIRLSTPLAIAKTSGRTIGLVVDRILSMVEVPAAGDRHESRSDGSDGAIISIVEVDGELIQVLDPDSLYDAEIRATLSKGAAEAVSEGDADDDRRA